MMIAKYLLFLWLTTLIHRLEPADLAGEWNVRSAFDSAAVAGGVPAQVELICTFERREAEALTGSCRPSDGPGGVAVQGRIEGHHVEWHFDVALDPHGKKQTVTFSGLLNDQETAMKGTVAIGDARGEFIAEKT